MILSIKIQLNARVITLVNVYAPNSKTQQQVLFNQYKGLWDTSKPIIFMGDWNFVDDPHNDIIGRDSGNDMLPPQAFEIWREIHQLIDATKIRNNPLKITRWNVQHSSGSRLDRMYVSGNMGHWVLITHNHAIPCALSSSQRHTISDHNLISTTIAMSDTPKGEGYWKLNIQILKNFKLQSIILRMMQNFLLNSTTKKPKFKRHDILKGHLIMVLRDWSKARAKHIAKDAKKIKQYVMIIEDETQKTKWKKTSQ